MTQVLIDMLKQEFMDKVLPEIIDALMVQSVAIVGGLASIMFVVQMVTGKAKWGKRAYMTMGVGMIIMVIWAAL